MHSSAKFYITGVKGVYQITGYTEILDLDVTVMKEDGNTDDATFPANCTRLKGDMLGRNITHCNSFCLLNYFNIIIKFFITPFYMI